MRIVPLRLAVALLAFCLAGYGRGESYRYKLTVEINTPEGVKRTSNVVEIEFSGVSVPARGVMHKLNGEALYLDLGDGRRPLIVSIVNQLHPLYGKDVRWSRDGGPSESLWSELYGAQQTGADLLEKISALSTKRGSHEIRPDDLPDLLTFADINVPSSVMEVDRHNLPASLGQNVSWANVALEVTNEPITKSINSNLPWLQEYREKNLRLDGASHGAKRELANILSWSNFEQTRDLKRTR
ncbi:hypothetical protein KUL72_28195 [Bradyrhizobium arachidis]|uniref:hypothetical protein n=1 Tax=Bradyrhizobium arachidis TaxID=858423 RepID=UPI002161C721|nr:hypothetical protein [Bradyrhizobium arachidis]UVO35304.1 hypothetical protein KUL72_28195 [Bradyrhizobium arachidis]